MHVSTGCEGTILNMCLFLNSRLFASVHVCKAFSLRSCECGMSVNLTIVVMSVSLADRLHAQPGEQVPQHLSHIAQLPRDMVLPKTAKTDTVER